MRRVVEGANEMNGRLTLLRGKHDSSFRFYNAEDSRLYLSPAPHVIGKRASSNNRISKPSIRTKALHSNSSSI